MGEALSGNEPEISRKEENTMKLSIVIPAYNEEAYLGKCLESVLCVVHKSAEDIEVIVVNNASTDRTGEVARSFSGVRVVDEPKKGLVRARQAGFLASTGDLIANIDADTLFPDTWIDTVFSYFRENEKLVALSGPYIYYDLSRLTNSCVWAYYSAGFLIGLLRRLVFRREGVMLQGGNFILRRSTLEEAGGYDLSFDFYGEDTAIARRMGQYGDVVFTFRLPMYTSGRRLMKEGLLVMGFRYAMNHLSALLWGKPFTKTSSDIRL